MKQYLTFTFEGSMRILSLMSLPRTSLTAERPITSSAAVWMQRRNGETMSRCIGSPRLCRILCPIWNARTWPGWVNGGSHGRAAVDVHEGTKLSIRSPCLITMIFWYIIGCWFSKLWFPPKFIFTVTYIKRGLAKVFYIWVMCVFSIIRRQW